MADGDISTQAEAQSLAGVGVADDFDLAAEVTNHADKVLKASGSALKHYTTPSAKRAILSAMMDAMEAAYRAGAKFAERLYEDRFTRLTEANAAQAREIEGLRAWRDNEAVPTLAAIRVSCFNWDEHTGRHFHTMIRDVLVAAQSTITGGQP